MGERINSDLIIKCILLLNFKSVVGRVAIYRVEKGKAAMRMGLQQYQEDV